jgi:hypothetical protein
VDVVGGDAAAGVVDPASPRAAAEHLLRLRTLAATGTAARRAWVRSLREVADDVRRAAPLVRTRADVASRDRTRVFADLRNQLAESSVPASCQGCHLTLGRWFDRMIDSCEGVAAFAADGDAAHLQQAQAALNVANEYARGFNEQYAALVQELHALMDARGARLPLARAHRTVRSAVPLGFPGIV